jgi:DNA-binding beta-propeller fold protein YncE/PKD repeat protein
MKTKVCLYLFVILSISLLPIRPGTAASPPNIASLSPSAGWTGTTSTNGTLVKIKGTGFEADPGANDVRFTDGSGSQTIQAHVEWSAAAGALYKPDLLLGSPGSALGQLDNPWDISVDKDNGDVYVVNLNNQRIEVFNKAGAPLRMVGAGTLGLPWSVALDQNKNIYVSDRSSSHGKGIIVFTGRGDFRKTIGGSDLQEPRDLAVDSGGSVYIIDQGVGQARLVKFDNAGNKVSETDGPAALKFYNLESLALEPAGTALYLADNTNKAVYKYNQALELQGIWRSETDWGFPAYLAPEGGISVDWQGFVYVPFGGALVAKVSSAGQLVAEIDLGTTGVHARFAFIDSYKRLFASDSTTCQCVRVFSPVDSGELWVRVPPGARTGPVKVTTPAGSALSAPFTVFTASGTPILEKLEVTQGLASYPFVSGKETLVWVKVKGLFGDPSQDVATIWVVLPGAPVGLAYNFSHLKYDYQAKTTELHYHLPAELNKHSGKYQFEVLLKRGNTTIVNQTLTKTFYPTKERAIAFFRFSDVPPESWKVQDAFPWFDMQTFLHGLATFRRVFPLHPGEVTPYFGEGIYADFLRDGIQEEEKSEVTRLVKLARNQWYESEYKVHLFSGLLDGDWRVLGANGWAPYGGEVSSAFLYKPSGSIYTWGKTFAHEVGHNYDLVPEGKSNYDPTQKLPGGDPLHHSKNQMLNNEDGAPVMVWNSIQDTILPGGQVGSIMGYNGSGEDNSIFESRFENENVDYHVLFGKLSDGSAAMNQSSTQNVAMSAPLQKLALIGGVSLDGEVTIDASVLTTAELPITPSEGGDYSLAFLDSEGNVLAEESFSPAFTLPDAGLLDEGIIDLVRPYPDATAKVDIRWKGRVLASLAPSASPPVVSNVVVSLGTAGRSTISWSANDPDGDSLTYSVFYSPDGGATFRPIASGLTTTELFWDGRLVGGSSNALVRVDASDGFYRGSGSSSIFGLAQKPPQVVILSPIAGARIPEGAFLSLRGMAFDPEDGLLDSDSLTWELDGEIIPGSGEALSFQSLPISVPTGTFDLPLPAGTHTLRLLARDSQGAAAFAEIAFTVLVDSDRDGIPDEVEESGGGDPADPFTRPQRPPVADPDGPYAAGEGEEILFDDTQSYDPDGDPLSYAWEFGDGTTLPGPVPTHAYLDEGVYTASLTVTDPLGGQDTATTVVTVHNRPPTVYAGLDRRVDEGALLSLEGVSFNDPGLADTHSAGIDWGDGSPLELALIGENSGVGAVSGSHVYGDNGTFSINITVCDNDGACGQDSFSVTVENVSPGLTLDGSDALAFPGGSAFLGRMGVEQVHAASATDPGSDDLTFTWSFGSTATYFNDGMVPDSEPSPAGTFPFSMTDNAWVTFLGPGVHQIGIAVADDDGGSASVSLPKLVTGADSCSRSLGFWKHQFSEPGAGKIDFDVLNAYLELTGFASVIFSEQVPAANFQQAHGVFWSPQKDIRTLAVAQFLAAWLNFSNGAVGWEEWIDTDKDKTGDLPFSQLMAEVESILLDPGTTHGQLVYAKNLVEAVNLRDVKNRSCPEEVNGPAKAVDQPAKWVRFYLPLAIGE